VAIRATNPAALLGAAAKKYAARGFGDIAGDIEAFRRTLAIDRDGPSADEPEAHDTQLYDLEDLLQ
jgi:hypothetical protein